MISAKLIVSGSLLLLAGCGSQASGTPPAHPSTQAISTSGSAGPSAAGQAGQAGQGNGRCATASLQFGLGQSAAATGNDRQTITVTNRSGSSCYLGGYPGVELLDGSGQHLQDAQRRTDSFFGTYAAPHRVDIPAGGATSFDLSFAGIDPCAGGIRAQRGTALKITPPNDYDSSSIPASLLVCPNTLVVHPVGSTVSTP